VQGENSFGMVKEIRGWGNGTTAAISNSPEGRGKTKEFRAESKDGSANRGRSEDQRSPRGRFAGKM